MKKGNEMFSQRVSPSLGALGAHGHVRSPTDMSEFRLFIKFGSPGSRYHFLIESTYDSAWFCMEKPKHHPKTIEKTHVHIKTRNQTILKNKRTSSIYLVNYLFIHQSQTQTA